MGLLFLAILLDWFVGDPDFLWRRTPHPVVWIGRFIDYCDNLRRNKSLTDVLGVSASHSQRDFRSGLLLLVSMIALCLLIGHLIGMVTGMLGPLGWAIEIVIVAIFIAQKSLKDHVNQVAVALKTSGVVGGRKAVSMIVGRDVSQLDESGISKAAIESLAENFSDGVVAPIFWYAVGGLPGLLIYKAINTADSMIGHRNEDYEYFGKPAALLDDWMNWPAARLSVGFALAAVALRSGKERASQVLSAVMRDAPFHRSPNAGWPEAAFAAALDLSLGGPRTYGEKKVEARALNADGRDVANRQDISRGLTLFSGCCFTLWFVVLVGWFLL